MSQHITTLDADTRDRIAAGEVVERPASVVKELLENALDADASRVRVEVDAGGTERIAVSDDGVGMSEADVRAAVREHTTSKLRSIDDLETIATLGFRGEALHAVGSVARLEIRTKPRGGTRGTELVVERGEVAACGPSGCPTGTTVEVTDLFGNVPARRKFLKTDATEFAHVQSIVAGYALAAPDVAITLVHDGRETFATTGDGDRRSAVMAVYGREVAESMIPVEARISDGDEESAADEVGAVVGVEGLISHPETNRAGSEYVTTLVDGRYVTASTVRDAVIDAYGTQLAPDRYPFAVVDVSLPAGGVDVNVHPRKLEVLFADAEGVRRTVGEAVEAALLEAGLLRSRASRGRSAPAQTEIHDRSRPASSVDESVDESAEESSRRSGVAAESEGDDDRASSSADPTAQDAERPPASPPAHDADRPLESTQPAITSDSRSNPSVPFRKTPVQRTLDGEETTGTPGGFDRLPSMRVLGQFDDTYLVAETRDGLVLIDQHAADERVHYERLRAAFSGDVTTQALADPVDLELTAREAALLDEYAEALSRLGFRVHRDGDREVTVTTVPALVAERVGAAAPELVRDVLSAFVDGDPSGTVEGVVDALLGDLACHPAVTGNTSLTEGSVAALLAALDDCENPYACPHGRPTIIELSREEIEDRFERDYPGHGGRRR